MFEGKSIGRYAHNRERDMQNLSVLPVFAVIAGISLFVMNTYRIGGQQQLILIIVAMLILGVWTTFTGLFRLWLKPDVELFEHGIRYTTRRGSQFWTWAEVEALHPFKNITFPGQQYGLIVNNKQVLVLNDRFQRLPALTSQIQTILNPTQVSETQDVLLAPTIPDEPSVDLQPKARFMRRTSLIPVLMALIGLGTWAYIAVYAVTNAIPDRLIDLNWLMWAAVSLIIPITAILTLRQEWPYLAENPRYTADEHGLYLTMRSGKSSWRWDEIGELRFVRTYEWLHPVANGTAVQVNGEPVVILNNRYKITNELLVYIQNKYADALKPDYLRRLTRGETLSFGPISIDQTGVKYLDKTFEWSRISTYDYTRVGWEVVLVLYDTDNRKLASISTFNIINISLLTQILHERLGLP